MKRKTAENAQNSTKRSEAIVSASFLTLPTRMERCPFPSCSRGRAGVPWWCLSPGWTWDFMPWTSTTRFDWDYAFHFHVSHILCSATFVSVHVLFTLATGPIIIKPVVYSKFENERQRQTNWRGLPLQSKTSPTKPATVTCMKPNYCKGWELRLLDDQDLGIRRPHWHFTC